MLLIRPKFSDSVSVCLFMFTMHVCKPFESNLSVGLEYSVTFPLSASPTFHVVTRIWSTTLHPTKTQHHQPYHTFPISAIYFFDYFCAVSLVAPAGFEPALRLLRREFDYPVADGATKLVGVDRIELSSYGPRP